MFYGLFVRKNGLVYVILFLLYKSFKIMGLGVTGVFLKNLSNIKKIKY